MYRIQSKSWSLAAAIILLAGSARGQTNTATTVVQAPGLNCTTAAGANSFPALSWTLTEGFVAATDHLRFDLTLVKVLDSCTVALILDLSEDKSLPSVTITDTQGSNVLRKIVLENVFITSNQFLGSGLIPTESVGLTFKRIQVTDNVLNVTFCWDNLTQSSICGS